LLASLLLKNKINFQTVGRDCRMGERIKTTGKILNEYFMREMSAGLPSWDAR